MPCGWALVRYSGIAGANVVDKRRQLISLSSGRWRRDLRLILTVRDGDQRVLDERHHRIRLSGLGERAWVNSGGELGLGVLDIPQR